jgi:tetratricopeptide (TPR) repeat protein
VSEFTAKCTFPSAQYNRCSEVPRHIAKENQMDCTEIQSLLDALKSEDAAVRDRATRHLWRVWFSQKGAYGLELLERSQAYIDAGWYDHAEDLLTHLIQEQPDFVEAWNRRAVVYYIQHDYEKSLADCQRVIEMNPFHFGALHGLGLCHRALGNYHAAVSAFHRVLELQPYAIANQRLLLECTMLLN